MRGHCRTLLQYDNVEIFASQCDLIGVENKRLFLDWFTSTRLLQTCMAHYIEICASYWVGFLLFNQADRQKIMHIQ